MTNKRYEIRKQMKSVRWMIFWVVLAQFAAETVVEAVVSFMSNPPHKYIQVAVTELFAIGIPIVVYAKTQWNGQNKNIKEEFCLNRPSFLYVLLGAFLGVSGQFVMMILNVPANIIVSLLYQNPVSENIPVAASAYELVLGIFTVVIVPAVLEEFWMRGIIFSAFSKCNTVAAVLFTGLIFAFLHLSFSEMVGFFFMSVLASILMAKSKSLYVAMIYHAFSNLTALLFGAYIMPGIIEFIWAFFLVMILVFAGAFVVLIKQKNNFVSTKNFSAVSLITSSVFSIPVLLSVLVVVLKSILFNIAG